MDIAKVWGAAAGLARYCKSHLPAFTGSVEAKNTDAAILGQAGDAPLQLIPRSIPAVDAASLSECTQTHAAIAAAASGGANPHSAAASRFYFDNRGLRDLGDIARLAMIENGLTLDISSDAAAEAEGLKPAFDPAIKDLRGLNWISIDHEDSEDLDQISAAERLESGDVKLLVAVADVDALAPKGSFIDKQAFLNTATIYTPTRKFWMVPEKLATDLSSLKLSQDRRALVTEMVFAPDGTVKSFDIYPAMVNNHAKLVYNEVAGWLDGSGKKPEALNAPGVAEQITIQDELAQKFAAGNDRASGGEKQLSPRIIVKDGKVVGLTAEERNRAEKMIEKFMAAANQCADRFLSDRGFPVFRHDPGRPTRATAPNRLYRDLVAQRLLKAAASGDGAPYSEAELAEIGRRCSTQKRAISSVDRRVLKSASALFLESKVGERFEAVISNGYQVRLIGLPVEGKLRGKHRVSLGRTTPVKLKQVSVENGRVDFQAWREIPA